MNRTLMVKLMPTEGQHAAPLVAKAKDTGRGMALEDLNGIRERISVKKAQRRVQHSWGFHQLGSFIEDKARLVGVPGVLVDPRNRACPACGHGSKANRLQAHGFSHGVHDIVWIPKYRQPVLTGTVADKAREVLLETVWERGWDTLNRHLPSGGIVAGVVVPCGEVKYLLPSDLRRRSSCPGAGRSCFGGSAQALDTSSEERGSCRAPTVKESPEFVPGRRQFCLALKPS